MLYQFHGMQITNIPISHVLRYVIFPNALRVGGIKSDGRIDDINDNTQDEDGAHVNERQSRRDFRKWENTKFISKTMTPRRRPISSYEDRLWGIAITSKERLGTHTQKGLNFGVVITLREIKGVNRIQDFIRACQLRGWIINELHVENQVDLYNVNQEELELE